jgi:hypothetical protein
MFVLRIIAGGGFLALGMLDGAQGPSGQLLPLLGAQAASR